MIWFILFVFGTTIGSFLNVVALRYDGNHFVFDPKSIGGRSHCPHCQKTLRWFELIPLVSFLIQGGKCRRCGARIGWRYFIMEVLSGLIFVFIPFRFVFVQAISPELFIFLSAFWIIAFEILLLIGYIDILLGIIPDELNVALLIIGFVITTFVAGNFGLGNSSFLGSAAIVLGLQSNIWISHFTGALFGLLFFGGIVFVTRGKGMGMGDVKLALPLGLLFSWPDMLIITALAFVLGAVFGVGAIVFNKKSMKSAVPFGPFLVLSAAIIFFFGSMLFNAYFHMTGL
jgi:prepilin signal peptidase PulO-like enzyme (type II secretory pathway)